MRPSELPGAIKGIVLGFCNTVLVAFCVGMTTPGSTIEPFFLVLTLGMMPGLMTGALLGHLAAEMKHVNRHLVLAGLIGVSCLAVVALGDMFDVQELVFTSCFPTAAACSVLERWTRARPVDERLPLARVA
jgi:hypothetical protein